MRITVLYNEPVLPPEHPDYLSEAGVLESVSAFEQALLGGGHSVERLGIGSSLADVVTRLQGSPIDVVVNLCEGFAGRPQNEIYIAGMLELLGLPYTGATPECLSLTYDKAKTKRLLAGAKISTAEFHAVPNDRPASNWLPRSATVEEWATRQFALGPLFVKPAAQDASLGISNNSIVHDIGELADRLRYVHRTFGDALVETYIDGREFNVGVIALPTVTALPVAEIEFDINRVTPYRIVTYDGKWDVASPDFLATPVRCPAEMDSYTAERIRWLAIDAYHATGCRDYARVDLRMKDDGEIFVLEVNANPDAGPSAGLARALAVSGISYEQFVLQLVETAVARKAKTASTAPAKPQAKVAQSTAKGESSLSLATGNAASAIRDLQPTDRDPLLSILKQCKLFRADEIAIADEILQESFRDGDKSHYQNLIVECDGQPIGWSCHGLVPLTDATYDLYWIAVHPAFQQRGIGRQLLREVETRLRTAAARWLLAETSSTATYDNTRAFYERCGYTVVGDVAEFYRPGDGRITFGKRLDLLIHEVAK